MTGMESAQRTVPCVREEAKEMRSEYTSVYRQELPIVNADRWLKSERIRIFLGTVNAARLANRSIRRQNREIRHQRGRWM